MILSVTQLLTYLRYKKKLTMKINNMLLLGGILDVVIMLDSFSRGVKD
jgi:hypothetical protein